MSALVRVFEIPPPTGRFHFGGGEAQAFIEVDWFRDEAGAPDIATPEGRKLWEKFIRGKRYFSSGKAYLVLHPDHPFTINYRAP